MRIHFRHLSEADTGHQAEAFARMYEARPTGDWSTAFDGWADGKDFAPGDRAAIRFLVQQTFLASGTLTFTDLAS